MGYNLTNSNARTEMEIRFSRQAKLSQLIVMFQKYKTRPLNPNCLCSRVVIIQFNLNLVFKF